MKEVDGPSPHYGGRNTERSEAAASVCPNTSAFTTDTTLKKYGSVNILDFD